MTYSEYTSFKDGLTNIENISKKSKDLYKERMDIENDIVSRLKEFQDKVQLEQKWDDLISIFEKYVQLFNSVTR